MINQLANKVRRRLRSIRRAGHYPLLLPHFTPQPHSLRSPLADEPLPPRLLWALSLCDGTRTLRQISSASSIPPDDLLAQHEQGRLILWPHPIPPQPAPPPVNPSTVILSPHLDDAAICLGGFMLQHSPGRCLILDVFSNSPWWRLEKGSEAFSPSVIQQTRDAEEALMARLTQCALQRLDFPEALLRGHALSTIFDAPPTPADLAVLPPLRATLAHLHQRHPNLTWLLPLAIGNHLDHRLVRDESLAVLESMQIPPDRITFYEDLPYAAEFGVEASASPHSIPARLKLELRASAIDISSQLRQKVELARIYWSQLTPAQVRMVEDYARRIAPGHPAERIWHSGRSPCPR